MRAGIVRTVLLGVRLWKDLWKPVLYDGSHAWYKVVISCVCV